jgi:dTDP-4-dehydrorhamnose 3,5-epimerase
MDANYKIASYDKTPIHGVKITPLRRIADERGAIFHMLKEGDPHFQRFGEIYFSMIHPQVIKAWHIHHEMTLNYSCISGKIKLVLFDEREDSPTKGLLHEICLGRDNYSLVTIPPKVWNGFKGLGDSDSIVANCATLAHRVDEIERLDPFSPRIGYGWETKHG